MEDEGLSFDDEDESESESASPSGKNAPQAKGGKPNPLKIWARAFLEKMGLGKKNEPT